MPVIRCKVKNCTYRGTECCTAKRIEIDWEGNCLTACTFEQLMKQRPNQSEKVKNR